jgi:hypothetical protein
MHGIVENTQNKTKHNITRKGITLGTAGDDIRQNKTRIVSAKKSNMELIKKQTLKYIEKRSNQRDRQDQKEVVRHRELRNKQAS